MRRSGDSLFGPAFPFHGLFCAQGAKLLDGATILVTLFQDREATERKCARIHALVAEAEAGSREIARQLALTLILPQDRDDIRDLNLAFSGCMRAVRALATRFGLYDFQRSRGTALDLAEGIAGLATEITRMLEGLNRAGDAIRASGQAVAQLCAEADQLLLLGLGELYERPSDMAKDVLDIVKWSHIYDRFEDVFRQAEHVAQAIEGIALKRA